MSHLVSDLFWVPSAVPARSRGSGIWRASRHKQVGIPAPFSRPPFPQMITISPSSARQNGGSLPAPQGLTLRCWLLSGNPSPVPSEPSPVGNTPSLYPAPPRDPVFKETLELDRAAGIGWEEVRHRTSKEEESQEKMLAPGEEGPRTRAHGKGRSRPAG